MDNYLKQETTILASWISHSWFNVEYNGLENIPERGAAVLFPKHRAMGDIPLIASIFHEIGRCDDVMVLMKQGLFKWFPVLEHFGFPVARPKDIKRALKKYPKDRDLVFAQAKQMYNNVKQGVLETLSEGGLVWAFPEGTRIPDRVGKLSSDLIDWVYEGQTEMCRFIPIIPMGLEYPDGFGFRSRAKVNVGRAVHMFIGRDLDLKDVDIGGKDFYTRSNVAPELECRLKELSGLQ